MKKYLMMIAALVCCTVMITVMTACGNDDDDIVPVDLTPAFAEMEYSLNVGDDMLEKLDLTVEYRDDNGKLQTEAMTGKKWKKTVTAKLPVTLGVRLKAELKEGVDPATIEAFSAEYSYLIHGYIKNAEHSVLSNFMEGNDQTTPLTSENINIWLETRASHLVNVFYDFAADGKVKERSKK